MEFPSEQALKRYLDKHPKAKPGRHTVKDKGKKDEAPAKAEPAKGELVPEEYRTNKPPKQLNKKYDENPSKPNLVHAPQHPTDADAKDIVHLFHSLDRRVDTKDTMSGLQNAKRLVNHYYRGEEAKDWHAAIDSLIEQEHKTKNASALRVVRAFKASR